MKISNALAISFFLNLAGCVSVSLGPKKAESAKDVKMMPPPGVHFSEFVSPDADHAWKDSAHGTSISYKSTCNDSSDSSLEGMQQSTIYGLENIKILKSSRIPYNGREALNSVIEGKLDGVATKIELLILKKNSCNYILSYVALDKSFDVDNKYFKTFIESFEAP